MYVMEEEEEKWSTNLIRSVRVFCEGRGGGAGGGGGGSEGE